MPVPESRATLIEQQRQLLDGDRAVQMFPKGHPELTLPRGLQRLVVNGDVFHFDKKRITPKKIIEASKAGRENELLGLGPVSKEDTAERVAQGEHPLAVVERTPDGVEARAASGTDQTAAAQVAAMNRVKSNRNNVAIEHPGHTIAGRFADGGNVEGMLEPGNIDLANRPVVHNADGSISTVRSIGTNIDGREMLLPTVYGDSILSDEDAIRLYRMSGKHLGQFDTPKNSDAYAQSLHEDQAEMYKGRASGGAIHMADGGDVDGPAAWGAVPVSAEGPAAWGAVPVEAKPAGTGALDNSADDGWLSGAAKGAGTAIVKGLSNSVGTIGNLGNFADYVLARGHSAITGRPVQEILGEYAKAKEAPSLHNMIDPSRVMPSGEDVSAPILKRTGEYHPESEIGRMAQSGVEAAAGMVGPGGGAVSRGTGAGQALLRSPAAMAPVNALAGAAGQGVVDATGDPLLGMATGLVAPASVSAVSAGARRVAQPFLEDIPGIGPRFAGTRDAEVGKRLLSSAENPDVLDRALNPGPMRPGDELNTDLIPGSKPTLGQMTGDMGILQAERQARTADNTAFNIRDAEQNSARFANIREMAPEADTMRPSKLFQDQLETIERGSEEAVRRIEAGAQRLAGQLGPGESPEVSGASLRATLEAAKAEAKRARTKLYDAVDPDGSVTLVATPIRERAQELAKGVDEFDTPLSPVEARIFGQIGSLPDVVPFKSLVALDKNIYAAMSAERRAAGETTVWGRLSQLKKSAMDAINNAVDNQYAYEQAAVSAGKLKPSDTIDARLEQVANEYGGHIGGSLGNARTAAVGDGRQPTAGPAGFHGTESEANGRFGDAASSPRVPARIQPDQAPEAVAPSLQPNFDKSAADRLRAAKTNHAEFAQTYRNPTIKRAMSTQGGSDNYTTPASALPSKAVLRGPQGYETAQAYLKAAKKNPDAIASMQDAALSPLRASLKPDGTINTAKFNAWKRDYAGALKALDEVSPGFSKKFDNAARASDLLVEAGALAKQKVDDFQKSVAAKFLKQTDPVEVENKVGSVLTEKAKGPTEMRDLVKKLSADPDALEGLRKAGIDWIVRKFSTTAEAGTSGEKILSSAAFRTFVRDNQNTLAALYPAEQVNMFRRIGDDLQRANRSVTATGIKGSPGTAKDALPFMKKSMEEAKKHASFLSAAMAGSLIGFETAGLKGAAVGATTAGGAYLLGSLRASGIRKADDMFRDALLNPERARYYLAKASEANKRTGPSYALARALRRELMNQPVVNEFVGDKKRERAPTGR